MSSFQNVGYNVELSIALNSFNMGVAIINFPALRISFETMSKDVDLLFGKLDISSITSARVIGLSSSDATRCKFSDKYDVIDSSVGPCVTGGPSKLEKCCSQSSGET